MNPSTIAHPTVSPAEWLTARKELLAQEKLLTRQRDEVDRQRRALPWVKIEKPYTFTGPNGPQTLSDLFDGRSQLILAHFMFGPDWKEGCVGCSFRSDHVDGALPHLEHHDVSFASISRAPFSEIEAFQRRMGWHFRWLSSFHSDFNYDFRVSFTPEQIASGEAAYNFGTPGPVMDEMSGLSVFYKDPAGNIFHTYSTFGRGDETVDTTYMYLDLTPKGRNEIGPHHNLMDWVRHHDRYDAAGHVNYGGRFVPEEPTGSTCNCSH